MVQYCQSDAMLSCTLSRKKELRMFGWKDIRQNIQKSESEKSKSMLFDFSTFLLPYQLLTFRLFFFLLNSQRFKFCTLSCACSAGKASGKRSLLVKKLQVKKYTVRLSGTLFDFRLFLLFDFSKFIKKPFHCSTFCFRLLEIDFACFPPGALQQIFPTQTTRGISPF